MSTLTAAQHWMINSGAILADDNGMPDNELNAFEPYDHEMVELTNTMFSRDWQISNKQGVLNMVDNMITGEFGHNGAFCQARDYWARFTDQQIADSIRYRSEDQRSDIKLACEHAQALGPHGIRSWDLGRCPAMIRNAYSLSWISEDEAWRWLHRISIELQKSYQSWEQAGTAYIVGRLFWAKGGLSESTCNDYFARLKKILVNPNHAWNTLDWNTDLAKEH